jgi:hypothetical protein
MAAGISFGPMKGSFMSFIIGTPIEKHAADLVAMHGNRKAARLAAHQKMQECITTNTGGDEQAATFKHWMDVRNAIQVKGRL